MFKALFLVAVTAGALLLGGSDPEPSVIPPTPAVELDRKATREQVAAIEARLRAVPGVLDVRYLDGAAQIANWHAQAALVPGLRANLGGYRPEDLAPRLQFTLRNRRAVERVAASPLAAELRRMPGVDKVIISPRRIEEPVSRCVTRIREMPGMPVVRDVKVFLNRSATPAEKDAVAQRLRRVPGAAGVKLTTREQMLALYRDLSKDRPETPALSVAEMPEGWVLTVADRAAAERTVDERLDEDICRMTGVDRVFLPPKV